MAIQDILTFSLQIQNKHMQVFFFFLILLQINVISDDTDTWNPEPINHKPRDQSAYYTISCLQNKL